MDTMLGTPFSLNLAGKMGYLFISCDINLKINIWKLLPCS